MPNAKRQVKLSREKKVARRMSRTDPQVLRGSLFGVCFRAPSMFC